MPPPGGKIIVTDEYGYLPKNPDEWPAELKREIRDCCCGASSSLKPGLSYPSCCNVLFPEEMRGNIRNSDTHDTSLRFRYWPAFSAYSNRFGTEPTRPLENAPPWIDRRMLPSVPNDYAILGGFNSPPYSIPYAAGWWSDVIFDFEATYTASGLIFNPGNPFGGIPPTTFNFTATWTTKVYYYAYFPYNPDFNVCNFQVYQCAFPEGTLTTTQTGIVGIPATDTFPITWLNNAGIGLIFTQRYPNDGNDNPLPGGFGPGGWLTFDPNVKSSVIASWSAGGINGCMLLDCNNKIVRANPVYFPVTFIPPTGIFSFGSLYNATPQVNIPSQSFPVGFQQTFNIDDYDEGVEGCGGLNNPGYQDNKTLVEIFP